SLIRSNPRLVRAFVRATVRGYEDTLKNPERSLNDLLRLNPILQRKLARASLDDYLTLYDDHGRVPFGTLRAAKLSDLVSWMLRYLLISRPTPVSRLATNQFLPASRSPTS